MNKTFDYLVRLLEDWARFFHMTYKEINIWIFVIIEPIVFFVMAWIIFRQYLLLKKYKNQ